MLYSQIELCAKFNVCLDISVCMVSTETTFGEAAKKEVAWLD